MSTTREKIAEILKSFGFEDKVIKSAIENHETEPQTKVSPKKANDKLPRGYISARYTDLLGEIKYFPNGNAPKEHNIFWSSVGKNCWYCSDKPVAIRKYDDGKLIKIADNAYQRYIKSVASRWALERDWIPNYRYSLEDNESIVGAELLECLKNGVDIATVTKRCFDELDFVYRAKPDKHKTLPKEQICNDAERALYLLLFMGFADKDDKANEMFLPYLPKLVSEVDGSEVPATELTAVDDILEDGKFNFEKIKLVFDRVKDRHSAASIETWHSALLYALQVPTKEAIQIIYGDRADGKKKFRRCEVLHSSHAKQVFTWLLEEIQIMQDEGIGDGLDKWIEVLKRDKAMANCRHMYSLIKKYNLMGIGDKSPQEEGIMDLIIVNPFKASLLLEEVISEKENEYDADFFGEIFGFTTLDDDEVEAEEVNMLSVL